MNKTSFLDIEDIGLEIETISTLTDIATRLLPGPDSLRKDAPASLLAGEISRLSAILYVLLEMTQDLAERTKKTSEAMRDEEIRGDS